MNFIKGKTSKQQTKQTYQLTKEEQQFLKEHMAMRNHYDYIAKLVQSTMQDYVDLRVRKRLGLSMNVVPEIDEVKGVLYVTQEVEQHQENNAQTGTTE